MRMTRSEFLAWPNKAVTLLGMSGVGKTTLANRLPKSRWFHYSGDYRIGTKYLGRADPGQHQWPQAMLVEVSLGNCCAATSIYIAQQHHRPQPRAGLHLPGQAPDAPTWAA